MQYTRRIPRTEAEFRERVAYNVRLGEDCRAHTGPLFDHVDTLSTVRDMDAIRAALGEEKLNYFSASYGTQIGQQYAEEFPERIRAMVLDSNVDHSVRSGFRYLQANTEDLEASFLEFAKWCGRTPACELHGKDVIALWDGLYEKAERGTLINPATGKPMSADALVLRLQAAMYLTSEWFKFARTLSQLDTGGLRMVQQKAAEGEVAEHAYTAIICQDWNFHTQSFHELDTYRRALAAMYPHTRMTSFWRDIPNCIGYPVKVNNPQHRLSAPDAPPILMVTSRYDVGTPYDWNMAAHRQLKNSVMLYYDGVGHTHYEVAKIACTKAYIDKYLTTLAMPPKNTHCAAEWPVSEAAGFDGLNGLDGLDADLLALPMRPRRLR